MNSEDDLKVIQQTNLRVGLGMVLARAVITGKGMDREELHKFQA